MKNKVGHIGHLKINTDCENNALSSISGAMPEIKTGKKNQNDVSLGKKKDFITPKNKKENLNTSNIAPTQNYNTPKPVSNFNLYKGSNTSTSAYVNAKGANILSLMNDQMSNRNIYNISFNLNNKSENVTNIVGKTTTPPVENPIEISDLLSSHHIPLSLNSLSSDFPQFESSRCSVKATSVIKAYAANTHQGIVRNYNEDRVAIIMNIVRPSNFTGEHWPQCSIFAIYDGHGGNGCSEYLKDNLHEFVVRDSHFPMNPREAILRGFEAAERDFLANYSLNKNYLVLDRSGSCALFCMILDDTCYIANVGDSRAIISLANGNSYKVITRDHKPNDPEEEKRILSNGGKVYQTQTLLKNFNFSSINRSMNNFQLSPNQPLLGPFRVIPGRLSVCRAFGDVEAKIPKLGGNPQVIISTPEIFSFPISEEIDFLLLGCDGIYDQLTDREIVDCVLMTQGENFRKNNLHHQVGLSCDMILKSALNRKSLDNVTCVLLAFDNFEKNFYSNNTMGINSTNKFCIPKSNSNSISNSMTSSPRKSQSKGTAQLSELRLNSINSFRNSLNKKTQLRLFKKPTEVHHLNQIESPINKIKSERIKNGSNASPLPCLTDFSIKRIAQSIQNTSLLANEISKEYLLKVESARTAMSSTNKPSLQKFLGLKKISYSTVAKKNKSFKEMSIKSALELGGK